MLNLIPVSKQQPTRKFFEDDFDSLFNKFFDMSWTPALKEYGGTIKVDIKEEENKYILEAEMPGIEKQSIKLKADNGYLTLSVEQQEENQEESKKYIRRERKTCSMSRTFNIESVDEDKIEANYENGILYVSLPKKQEETAVQKEIEIR